MSKKIKPVQIEKILAVLNYIASRDPKAAESLLFKQVPVNDAVRRMACFPMVGRKRDCMDPLGVVAAAARTVTPGVSFRPTMSRDKKRRGVKLHLEEDLENPSPSWYDAFGADLGLTLSGLQARLTDSEKRWMWETVQGLPENAVYVEVGTDKGGSAHIVALANPTVRIFTIDPMNADGKRRKMLHDRYGKLLSRIELVPYLSVDEDKSAMGHIGKKLNEPYPEFDMVFLDGAHTDEDITQEIDLFLPHMRPGGMLCGHDFHRNFGCRKRYSEAVVRAIEGHGLSLFVFDRIWYAPVPFERRGER